MDQYVFDVGNPRLQPQFTTNYELNVTFDGFPVLAGGINETKDIFSNVTYQDDATRIAYRTYDNLGKSKEYYARIWVAFRQAESTSFTSAPSTTTSPTTASTRTSP